MFPVYYLMISFEIFAISFIALNLLTFSIINTIMVFS